MWGCSALAAGTTSPPAPAPLSSPATAIVAPTIPPTAPGYGECYYIWATQDLPQLSDTVNSGLKALDPKSSASAYAYGEDCVQADGTRTFIAMETDFRVKVPVADLSDKESLGNLIAKVMTVIVSLPTSQIEGPRPGRVEFEFSVANADSRRLNVDIATYRAQGAGMQGAPLFDLLNTAP